MSNSYFPRNDGMKSANRQMNLRKPEAFAQIITINKKMFSLFQSIESVSLTPQPVLITGATGVGKEMVAKVVHSLSKRKGNFVPVNAAGLDDNIFSDTLFGHIRGAFTGADRIRNGMIEKASNGTIFLDEIGDLSLTSQVKLLRLIQEREYMPLGMDEPKYSNARIVAATNKDLWPLQRTGEFREDLNFRLRTHHIHIPPLCERQDDIPILVDHFASVAADTLNKKKPTIPKELFTLFETYSFPGNIRELQAMIFDAITKHKSRILSLNSFKSHIAMSQKHKNNSFEPGHNNVNTILYPKELPTIKKGTMMLVDEAIKRAKGNQTIAAGILGISRQALSKRLKNMEIQNNINPC